MSKKIVLLLIAIFTTTWLFAEIQVYGKVSTTSHPTSTIPFANVVFFNIVDTTKVEYSSISDLKGNFTIPKVQSNAYQVVVSCVGYAPRRMKVVLPYEVSKYPLNFSLEEANQTLGEVTVSANRVRSGINKTTFIVSSIEKSKASTSLDLLGNIPSLNLNKLSRMVTGVRGGSVKILINGMNSSERDLLALRPDDVLKVEHFDFPPAKYAAYETVVNVVTKPLENGGEVGFDAQHAVTTGFANDFANYKYNWNRSQLSVLYSLNYRSYHDRSVSSNTSYNLTGIDYQRDVDAKSKFGYSDNNIDIGYTIQRTNRYALQVKVSPNYMVDHTANISTILSKKNKLPTSSRGLKETNGTQFNPVVDINYWYQLPNNQEITINVVGTGYYSKYNLHNIEQTTLLDTTLLDRMKSQNNKRSIISELFYSKQLKAGTISIGLKNSDAYSENRVVNSFNNPTYSTVNVNNSAFAELEGKTGRYSYQISMGLENCRFSESFNNNRYSPWSFRPLVLLGYSTSESRGAKVYYISKSNLPTLSQLSNNKIFIADGIISQGNPDLKPFRTHRAGFAYYYYTKRGSLMVNLDYNYAKNYIASYYYYTPTYIASSDVQGKYGTNLSLIYSGEYKPFASEWLKLKVNGCIVRKHQVNPVIGDVTHFSTPLTGAIEATYRKFTINYVNTLVTTELDGAFESSNENYSNLGLTYRGGSLSASINMFWPFTHSKYNGETIAGSVVHISNRSAIYDNASMVTFGLSYSFQYGSKYHAAEKKVNNSDTDTGVFK